MMRGYHVRIYEKLGGKFSGFSRQFEVSLLLFNKWKYEESNVFIDLFAIYIASTGN